MRRLNCFILSFSFLSIFVIGCRQSDPVSIESRERGQTLAAQPIETGVASRIAATSEAPLTIGAIPLSPSLVAPTIAANPVATAAPPTWPAPPAPVSRFSSSALTQDEHDAAGRLLLYSAPIRDDIALARAYRDAIIKREFEQDAEWFAAPPPEQSEQQTFHILNVATAATGQIEAKLVAASEHAYFWYDTDPTTRQPDPETLPEIAAEFDRVYEDVTAAFGRPQELDAFAYPQIHIVHASPAALCGSTAGCGLGGYFNAADALPPSANPHANQRRMFVVNADHIGSATYLSTLAHELRHLVEFEFDRREADWETEGSAVLAEELAGWPLGAQASGNAFLMDPDLQLNHWSETHTYRHYGQGYLLSRYLYERLGPELFRTFAEHPASGLAAIDALASEKALPMSGESLWLEFLTALALHERDGVPEIYRLGSDGLNSADMIEIGVEPTTLDTTVNQYGADYYRMTGNGELSLIFEGSALVPLLDEMPLSGKHFWYAGRSNFSESRLTRSVDLRSVASATLQYAVYHDIERQYDFAYVSVSTDGGASWQGLSAPAMQRKDDVNDPSGITLTDRFYTGRSEGWILEELDLSAYAGQEISLRFSYVTDSVATERGLALDNIAIPEIGFYDDVETIAGEWQAEGFVRATGYLPQEWHLQLITFDDEGAPIVTGLSLPADGSIEESLTLNGEAILIVAATAPATLEPAVYRLQVTVP